jgi:hypothetical protein
MKARHQGVLAGPRTFAGAALKKQLSEQARSRAMLNAMKYLEKNNSSYNSLPEVGKLEVRRILDEQNASCDPGPMPVVVADVANPGGQKLNEGWSIWNATREKCSNIPGGNGTYVRKAPVKIAFPDGQILGHCVGNFAQIGVPVKSDVSLAELIPDMASRSEVSHEISEKIFQLSAIENFTNPFPRCWLVNDETRADPRAQHGSGIRGNPQGNAMYTEWKPGKDGLQLFRQMPKNQPQLRSFDTFPKNVQASILSQLSTLHVIDFICGHGERRMQDLLFDMRSGTVSGIRNEFTLPSKIPDFSLLQPIQFVDSRICNGVSQMTIQDLADSFLSSGRGVDTEEFYFTCLRLEMCQMHLKNLQKNGNVYENVNDCLTNPRYYNLLMRNGKYLNIGRRTGK